MYAHAHTDWLTCVSPSLFGQLRKLRRLEEMTVRRSCMEHVTNMYLHVHYSVATYTYSFSAAPLPWGSSSVVRASA